MFHEISWHSYWTWVLAITFIYYLFVCICYFRESIRRFLNHWPTTQTPFVNSGTKEQDLMPNLFDGHHSSANNSNGEEHVAQSCMDELDAFFENQKRSKAVKSELMFSLYSILQKYPSLKSSEYKQSVTNIIATQSENICSIHLSAEELKGVWLG